MKDARDANNKLHGHSAQREKTLAGALNTPNYGRPYIRWLVARRRRVTTATATTTVASTARRYSRRHPVDRVYTYNERVRARVCVRVRVRVRVASGGRK